MSTESVTLEQVLADERGDAAILRRNGHQHDAELIERVCERVSRAAEEYLRFMSEPDARLRTNRSQEFLRSRYPEWEAQGHAYKKDVRMANRYLKRREDRIAAVFAEMDNPQQQEE